MPIRESDTRLDVAWTDLLPGLWLDDASRKFLDLDKAKLKEVRHCAVM